jgi:LysM repeat protein
LVAKKPFFWLCRAVIYPLVALIYRIYRAAKKAVMAVMEPMKDRAMSLLANRHAIHAVVIVVAFIVTATNIHASSGASPQPDAAAPRSIIGDLAQDGGNGIVVEDSQATSNVNGADVTYLGGQALSTQDEVASASATDGTDSSDGTDSIDGASADQYDDSETTDNGIAGPLSNAVRVQPQAGTGEEQPSTRTQIETYVVADGDTLGTIAEKYGLKIETLLVANGLSGRSIIHAGQSLKILPLDGVVYTTRKGDTLARIAKTYDTDPQKIIDANGLADGGSLSSGLELILPDGKLPAPPPPKRPTQIASGIKNILIPPPSAAASALGMIWPTAVHRITQYFGQRLTSRFHTGVDIAGPQGTPIYAADDGVVLIAGWNRGGYGNMVIIDHGGGFFTRYGHASKLLVQAGDSVTKGQVIALMGTTGRSTGPHLHFEVMTGDPSHRVNPLGYVK